MQTRNEDDLPSPAKLSPKGVPSAKPPALKIIVQKPESISFFIDLYTPSPIPTPEADQFSPRFYSPHPVPVLFFPKIALNALRKNSTQLRRDIDSKQREAQLVRDRIIASRKYRIHNRIETVKFRVLIHQSRERLRLMRLAAKSQHRIARANLNRHQIIQSNVDKFAAMVDKAQYKAIQHKMNKFMQLKKNVSESFLELVSYDNEYGTDYGSEITRKDCIDFLKGLGVVNPQMSETEHEIPHSSSSSSNETLANRQSFAESPASRIRRCKSLPHNFLDTSDDLSVIDIVSLLPPINRFTLRELELDEILSNAQLRHDLLFDKNLKFKPNVEQDPSMLPKSKVYWEEIQSEVALGEFYRIPLLITEIRQILIELLPTGKEQKQELYSNIDSKHIAQQMQHNLMDPASLVVYIAGVMKTNCAPIRDDLVDEMVQELKSGNIVGALEKCFIILEYMKLDYANHQISRLIPYLIENAKEYEWGWFKIHHGSGRLPLQKTIKWIQKYVKQDSKKDYFSEGVLQLISAASNISEILPETFELDKSRIIKLYNEMQDVTILSTILVIYRGIISNLGTFDHLMKVKQDTWVLLNDTESTMEHVTLYLAKQAGAIRKRELLQEEITNLGNVLDKTLAPNSKIYEMMQKRVYNTLFAMITNETSEIDKYGLLQVEQELKDLVKKIQQLISVNKVVYSHLYNAILEDLQNGGSKSITILE